MPGDNKLNCEQLENEIAETQKIKKMQNMPKKEQVVI